MRTRLAFAAIAGFVVIGAFRDQTAEAQLVSRQMPSLGLRNSLLTITVGTPEHSVRKAITSAKAELRPVREGTYLVGKQVGAKFVTWGTVLQFKDGRLTMATVEWTPTQNRKSDRDVVEALYGALRSLSRTQESCHVFTDDAGTGPGIEVKTVDVECPTAGRRVTLMTSRSDQLMDGGTVTVTESIFAPPY